MFLQPKCLKVLSPCQDQQVPCFHLYASECECWALAHLQMKATAVAVLYTQQVRAIHLVMTICPGIVSSVCLHLEACSQIAPGLHHDESYMCQDIKSVFWNHIHWKFLYAKAEGVVRRPSKWQMAFAIVPLQCDITYLRQCLWWTVTELEGL